jgi:hypothetical protein
LFWVKAFYGQLPIGSLLSIPCVANLPLTFFFSLCQLARLGGLDAVQAAASLLSDDDCLSKINASPPRAARSMKLSGDDIGLGDPVAVDQSVKVLARTLIESWIINVLGLRESLFR